MTGLEINEDADFQNRFWRIQRIAWVLGALVIVAALLGATGEGGVFARARTEIAPGAFLGFDRIARHQAPTRLDLRLSDPGPGPLDVHFTRQYTDHARIAHIQPEPESVASDVDGWTLHFRGTPGAVRIDVIPERPGTLRGELEVPGRGRAMVRHTVLP